MEGENIYCHLPCPTTKAKHSHMGSSFKSLVVLYSYLSPHSYKRNGEHHFIINDIFSVRELSYICQSRYWKNISKK